MTNAQNSQWNAPFAVHINDERNGVISHVGSLIWNTDTGSFGPVPVRKATQREIAAQVLCHGIGESLVTVFLDGAKCDYNHHLAALTRSGDMLRLTGDRVHSEAILDALKRVESEAEFRLLKARRLKRKIRCIDAVGLLGIDSIRLDDSATVEVGISVLRCLLA